MMAPVEVLVFFVWFLPCSDRCRARNCSVAVSFALSMWPCCLTRMYAVFTSLPGGDRCWARYPPECSPLFKNNCEVRMWKSRRWSTIVARNRFRAMVALPMWDCSWTRTYAVLLSLPGVGNAAGQGISPNALLCSKLGSCGNLGGRRPWPCATDSEL